MEQQEVTETVTTRSAGVRYGLISGIISIALFLVMSVTKMDMQGPGRWLGLPIGIVLIVLAHKYYKDNGDGYMSYGQGIGIAFWMALVSTVISSVFSYVYMKFIDTGFIEAIKDQQIEAMEQQGMSQEQIDQAMGFSSAFFTPEAMLIMGLLMGIIMTVIIALIVTIFTKKDAPEARI